MPFVIKYWQPAEGLEHLCHTSLSLGSWNKEIVDVEIG